MTTPVSSMSQPQYETIAHAGQQRVLRRLHLQPSTPDLTHTAAEWAAKQTEDGGLCAYCRTASGTTKDHVVPVSLGGSDAIGNIVPACGPCNSSKGAQPAPSQPVMPAKKLATR